MINQSFEFTKKMEEKSMGKLKKILCCMMAGIMLACTVPTAVTGLPAAKEVQAAVSVPTPSLVSATPYGKTKIVLKWKPVKGIHGYRIYRRTNGGKWQTIRNVSAKATAYTDLSVISGNEYTYTVRAYRRSGKNVIWGSYVKKGVKTIAGLNYLKINVYRKNLYVGDTYDLKINGTKLKPVWSTNNYKIAGVYSNGRILAKKPGKARITGVLGGKKFTCDVTVKNKPAKPSKMSQDYKTVINYVNKYGRLDESGNKYIQVYYDGIYTIVRYMKKTDQINLRTIISDPSVKTKITTDVLVNCLKSSAAAVKCRIQSYGMTVDIRTSCYANGYRSDDNLAFYDNKGNDIPNELSEAGDLSLNATLILCHELLMEKTQVSIGELGFEAFDFQM